MQLTDFLQDASGDWDLTRGLRRVPDRATYVRQNLSVALNFWLNEWFLDTRQGVDYFGLIWGTKFDKRLLEALFQEAAVACPGVGFVSSVVVRFDNRARKLYAALVAVTDTGDDVSGPYLVGVGTGQESEAA
jgi:hypothetical protein